MSIKLNISDIIPKYAFLSNTEAKILDIVITAKSGNAYGLWKTSGLKHYPTVLRALKKLEERRLVQVLSDKGIRGERIYAPTLVGMLVSYIINGEEKKQTTLVVKNSSLFRELYKIDKDDYWRKRVVQEIILDVYRKKEPRSVDDVIKNEVEDYLDDYVLNRLDEDPEWIRKISEVKWIRPLAVRVIEDELNRLKRNVEALNKLKKIFTAK